MKILYGNMINKPFLSEEKYVQHEADHLLPSSAEVKNTRSYTSTPPYVFMAWYLIKHKIAFMEC
jgi:hypothetical protein